MDPEILILRPAGGFVLSQQRYPAGTFIAEHRHDFARLLFVLSGSVREAWDGREFILPSGSVHWMSASRVHEVRVNEDALVLLIEMDAARFASLNLALGLPSHAMGDAMRLEGVLRKVVRELHNRSALAEVALQGLVMQLLADTARLLKGPASAPDYVTRAVEFVDGKLMEPLTTVDIAAAANVSADRLRVAFRRFFGCSVTEYVRKRRVDRAMDSLTETDTTLAELAVELGVCG